MLGTYIGVNGFGCRSLKNEVFDWVSCVVGDNMGVVVWGGVSSPPYPSNT